MKLNSFKFLNKTNFCILLFLIANVFLFGIITPNKHKSKTRLNIRLNNLNPFNYENNNLANDNDVIQEKSYKNFNILEITNIDLDNNLIEFTAASDNNEVNKQINEIFDDYNLFENQKDKKIYSVNISKFKDNRKVDSCNFTRTKKNYISQDKLIITLYFNENFELNKENNLFLKKKKKGDSFEENKITFEVKWNEKFMNKENLINDFIELLNVYCIEIKEFRENNKQGKNEIKNKNHVKNKKVLDQIDNAIDIFKNEQIMQKKRELLLEERLHIYDVKNKLEKILDIVKQ